MSFYRKFATAIALAAAVSSAAPAYAQSDGAATTSGGETPETTAPGTADAAAPVSDPKLNWLKVCDTLDDGQLACIMRQVVLNNGQFFGSFLLRDDPRAGKSQLLAIAAVPLGVVLLAGMRMQIDSGQPKAVPYMFCDRISCVMEIAVDERFVESLKKGGKLKLIAKTRQGTDLTVQIDLAGFTAVYEGDKYISYDQFAQQNTASSALEQSLQDRAEQIRKEKVDDAPAPASN